MSRVDHYYDQTAPTATCMVPAVTVAVRNEAGDVLLQKRVDNELWALPGGTVEIGETVAQTVAREVKEETGLDVVPTRLIGIYSDPNHVIEYDDGEVRQQFSLCFEASWNGGSLVTSSESTDVRFVSPAQIDDLPMHPSMRLRLQHLLSDNKEPHIG